MARNIRRVTNSLCIEKGNKIVNVEDLEVSKIRIGLKDQSLSS